VSVPEYAIIYAIGSRFVYMSVERPVCHNYSIDDHGAMFMCLPPIYIGVSC
jgi:hypothetical protein